MRNGGQSLKKSCQSSSVPDPEMQNPQRFFRSGGAFALVFCLSCLIGCGGPEFLLPLEGDPTEARELLEENEYRVDYRPGSVRAAEKFFQALNSQDGDTCWYLLDLRAAASWQAYQHSKKGPEANSGSIVGLLTPLFPKGQPDELMRSKATNAEEQIEIVAAWTDGSKKTISMAVTSSGWRILLAPPDQKLAQVNRDPSPTDEAEPVNFEIVDEPEAEQGRPPSNPFGGGGFGY